MSWFDKFKPEKKLRPIKLSEWEKVAQLVPPCRELSRVAVKVTCDDIFGAGRYSKVVLYLEEDHVPMVNAFFSRHYQYICKRFKELGYTFIYAPKEVEIVAKHYGTAMADVVWNAATLLEMLHCHSNDPVGPALAVIDVDEEREPQTAVLNGIRLDAENEEVLIGQLKAYWKELEGDDSGILLSAADDEEPYERQREWVCYEEAARMRCEAKGRERERKGVLNGMMKKIRSQSSFFDDGIEEFLREEPSVPEPEILSEEDEQLLREIQERVDTLRLHGVRETFIEQIVRMTVQLSHLQITDDARLLLTDYGKEVKMLPIDKVVYIFFLRHPEGVSIKALSDHKDELIDLYKRVLGKERLTDKQHDSIERLCNPLDNSINEKLSRIRLAFSAVVHKSVADYYIVLGSRGEVRCIPLDEDLIVWNEWGRR